MAEHNSATLELKSICQKYLGIGEKEACRQASLQILPFPVFRSSQKSPWLVRLQDLAAWIDSEREKTAKDWEKAKA